MADLPTSINDLSTTPSLNYPPGGENITPKLDDILRELSSYIASLRDGIAPLSGGTAGQVLMAGGTWGALPFASLGSKPNSLAGYGITDGMRFFAAGAALPASNIGPIWHEDYRSVMVWQVFNANGANYTGYASVYVGRRFYDSQQTPRTGTVKVGTAGHSKISGKTVQLWNWAKHNGLVLAPGSWESGSLFYADNGDGTFRVPDTRGYFDRTWDDGSGRDFMRDFGTAQADAVRATTTKGTAGSIVTDLAGSTTGSLSLSAPTARLNVTPDASGGQAYKTLSLSFGGGFDTHPYNTASLGVIQL